MNTRTNQVTRFSGTLFVDATGHGTIGDLAGADWEMTPDGRMGMSNMWTWGESDRPTTFPDTPWALPLTMEDFPYPRDFHGQWFWESGFDKDPINEAEAIRDWNLRAVYGAFNAMKNKDGAADHKNAILTWVAYIGGPRESRRLMGDIVLTQDDIVEKRTFPDGCVPSTWTIDLHYPKKQYAEKFPDNPFISIAEHDSRIDRMFGYPVPYRCFYSRNIENLFMAGRNISVTHEALGTTRVMKTCGMMGEVVGKAAAICVQHDCSPREVYTQHLSQLTEMFELPGKARRVSLSDQWVIPDDALPLAGARGPFTGMNPKSLKGVVVDDADAKLNGKWTSGNGLQGYVGWGYQYASANSGASMEFNLKAPADGVYTIRVAYLPHENRGSKVPVFWQTNNPAQRKTGSTTIDMRTPADQDGWQSVGEIVLKAGDVLQVTVDSQNAGGTVHADAVQILPQP